MGLTRDNLFNLLFTSKYLRKSYKNKIKNSTIVRVGVQISRVKDKGVLYL